MTERLLKHAVEGNVTAFKGELKETFNKTLGEKLRKIESEIYKTDLTEEKDDSEDDKESDDSDEKDDKKKKKDDSEDDKDDE